jgi:hypothetical protein
MAVAGTSLEMLLLNFHVGIFVGHVNNVSNSSIKLLRNQIRMCKEGKVKVNLSLCIAS